MGKESADEVAEVARRRLAALGRELARSGYPPGRVEPEEPEWPGDEDQLGDWSGPDPVRGTGASGRASARAVAAPVPEPGRHARRRSAGPLGAAGWLQDRLPPTLRGRVALGAGHVAVLGVVAVVALAVAAYATVRARPTVTAVPRAHTSSAVARAPVPAGPSPSAAAAVTTTGSAPSGTVVVDVAGKVRRPGVATLPAGSRVVDALRRAGGARAGVDLSSLNLARVLVDGEQILVGVAPAPGVAASAASQPGASGDGALVNLNTATPEQLDSLPGVGPVTARKIVAWRSAHGSFTAIDELLEVDGIGEKTLADMAPHLTL